MKLPAYEQSIIRPRGLKFNYPKLKGDTDVDAAIVGGGKTGIEAAYLLTEAGLKVAVIEQYNLGAGTTGHTTGKVTSQHGIGYADLIDRLGRKTAKLYANANEAAIASIEKTLNKESIDTGWQRADNFVFTTDPKRVKQFEREAKAAASLDLPASLETKTDLPFTISAAVKFRNQAHFSAQKYVDGLAEVIMKRGGLIFENSRAKHFKDGRQPSIKTAEGTIRAKDIIIATNVPTWPLFARGTYCAYEYPQMSYIVAGKPKYKLKGMYISPDDEHYSLLPAGETLLVGGENHIPFPLTSLMAKTRYQKLAEYGAHHFGIEKIDYRWKARDYIGYDGIPLVGKLYHWSKHLYIATGFKKWGLTNTTVAATILRDLILGQPNDLAEVYSPHRDSLIRSIPHAITEHFS
jgi:glycine/D-amino acid oxidase-like deaminating enzyme